MNPGSAKASKIRVVLLESSRIVAQLFGHALKRDKFEVVYAGSSSMEAVSAAAKHAADVAVISAAVDGHARKGFDVTRTLRSSSPGVRIIALLDHPTREAVLEAFQSGARGIFCKSEPLRALSKCIAAVHRGQVWASNAELEIILEAAIAPPSARIMDSRGADLLSNREQQVVAAVSEGLTNREIADRLHLSENTVKNYLFRIFDKLGISNRVELMMYAGTQVQPRVHAAAVIDPAETFVDPAAMFRWCQEAAERFVFAPMALAQMYREGGAMPKDKIAACMWLLIAEKMTTHVSPHVQEALSELRAELTDKQISEAKRKASDWYKKHGPPEPKPTLDHEEPQQLAAA